MKKKFLIIIYLIVFALAIFLIERKEEKKQREAWIKIYNSEFNGIIDRILYLKYHRGYPSLAIGGNVVHFGGFYDRITHHINLGDSIVKAKNSDTILLFRKDSLSNWNKETFTLTYK